VRPNEEREGLLEALSEFRRDAQTLGDDEAPGVRAKLPPRRPSNQGGVEITEPEDDQKQD